MAMVNTFHNLNKCDKDSKQFWSFASGYAKLMQQIEQRKNKIKSKLSSLSSELKLKLNLIGPGFWIPTGAPAAGSCRGPGPG